MDAGRISYRPAEPADAEFLFKLKNDEGVRQSSIQSRDGVRWEPHQAWLRDALENDRLALWIIELNGEPVGTWRMEKAGPDLVEVAIHLMPEARGKGIGAHTIRQWGNCRTANWMAKILDSNEASIGLFKFSGFAEWYTTPKACETPYHEYILWRKA